LASEEDADQTDTLPARALHRPASLRLRLLGLAIFLACGTVLGVAVWLKPDARGYGTHEQLGAGRCGMLVATGFPCPSCGMTTAFAYTVRGQWVRAIWAQPSGFLLALATVAGAVLGLWMLGTGRMPPFDYVAITPYRLFATLLIVLLGGWAAKIAIGLSDGTLPLRR
jgi:hypothetical protein